MIKTKRGKEAGDRVQRTGTRISRQGIEYRAQGLGEKGK